MVLKTCCVSDLKMLRKIYKNSIFIFVDRSHHSVLAPSKQLFLEYKEAEARFKRSYPEQKARELAWNMVRYEQRFRREMVSSSEAMAKIREIKRMVREGKDVWLVCWQKTAPCHRFILEDIVNKGDWK